MPINRTTFESFIFVLLTFMATGSALAQSSLDRRHMQIRGAHNGDSNDFTGIPGLAKSGMNSVWVSIGGHLASPDSSRPVTTLAESGQLAILNRWQAETAAANLQFFPMVDFFGTDDRKRWPPQRPYVNRAGERFSNMPCPNDPDLWHRKFGDAFVELARWAVQQPNVPGILMDTEMYGGDKTGFHDACFCEPCRKEIATQMKLDPDKLNLDNPDNLNRYRDISTAIVQKHAEQLRNRAREIYPNCILGAYLLDFAIAGGVVPPVYKGMTLGWGTPDNPVLVFSEVTYDFGYNVVVKDGIAFHGDHPGHLRDWQQRWKDWGAHAEMVGGLWISRIPPENVAENLYYFGVDSRGYWIYDLIHLSTGPRADFFALPGEGASEYWPEIEKGNAELDKYAESGGTYASTLKARHFTLPAPGIDRSRWEPLDVPAIMPVSKQPDFRFFGQEQAFYLSAAAGDTVRFTVVANDMAAGRKTPKKDAVAIVILDPSGNIVHKDKLTVEDLNFKPQPDTRFGGQRKVEFKPETTGTYCVVLKGIRYAYNLAESSHPWAARLASDRPSNLWQVKKFQMKTLPSARQAMIPLTLGRECEVVVRDSSGKQLAQRRIVPDDEKGLLVPLPGQKAMTLTVIVDGEANGTIAAGEGLEPWISASPFKP